MATVCQVDSIDGEACYLAEWYLPELSEQSVDDIVARLDAAAATATDEARRCACSSRCPSRPTRFCTAFFGAENQESVSRTCLAAGAPHQRLSAHVAREFASATIKPAKPQLFDIATKGCPPERPNLSRRACVRTEQRGMVDKLFGMGRSWPLG